MLGKKSPIVWVSGGDNGGKNPMKVKVKMIGPSGQVVEVSLANGKAVEHGGMYEQIIRHTKLKKGWVLYDLMESDEREALIRKRQAKHAETQADYAKLFETQLDRLTKAIEAGYAGNQRPQLTDEQLLALMSDSEAEKKAPRAKKEK